MADEPFNYLERLFVRQRLQKISAFSSVTVYKVEKVLSVRNQLAQ